MKLKNEQRGWVSVDILHFPGLLQRYNENLRSDRWAKGTRDSLVKVHHGILQLDLDGR